MRPLLHGAVAMGFFVIGLFFLRFFRDRRDTLFAFFAAAFGLMAANNIALALSDAAAETRVHLYIIRLVAFLLIIAGIVVKNRGRPNSKSR